MKTYVSLHLYVFHLLLLALFLLVCCCCCCSYSDFFVLVIPYYFILFLFLRYMFVFYGQTERCGSRWEEMGGPRGVERGETVIGIHCVKNLF